MEMIKVDSSNIRSVGYNDNKLYVEFSGGIYVYSDVPKELYDKLLLAESKGRFMNSEIKGKYSYTRLNEKL